MIKNGNESDFDFSRKKMYILIQSFISFTEDSFKNIEMLKANKNLRKWKINIKQKYSFVSRNQIFWSQKLLIFWWFSLLFFISSI